MVFLLMDGILYVKVWLRGFTSLVEDPVMSLSVYPVRVPCWNNGSDARFEEDISNLLFYHATVAWQIPDYRVQQYDPHHPE